MLLPPLPQNAATHTQAEAIQELSHAVYAQAIVIQELSSGLYKQAYDSHHPRFIRSA